MKNLTWQNPEQLFVAQELINKVKSKCCGIKVYQIWEKMLEKREHISIIVDEYGCLRGVVSMEDVIETMTGVEIVDEDDVAVDMQALAKEKSRMMHQGVASAIPGSKA